MSDTWNDTLNQLNQIAAPNLSDLKANVDQFEAKKIEDQKQSVKFESQWTEFMSNLTTLLEQIPLMSNLGNRYTQIRWPFDLDGFESQQQARKEAVVKSIEDRFPFTLDGQSDFLYIRWLPEPSSS